MAALTITLNSAILVNFEKMKTCLHSRISALRGWAGLVQFYHDKFSEKTGSREAAFWEAALGNAPGRKDGGKGAKRRSFDQETEPDNYRTK